MNNIRIVVAFVLCLLISISLIGCAKLVNTANETVDVTIVDEYYRDEYITYAYTGKVLIPINHSATYEITVEYNGIRYTIDDEDTYKKYRTMVGNVVNAVLEIRTYDDGTVKYDINTIGVAEED